MARSKHARKLFGPTDDLDLATATTCRLCDCWAKFVGMTDGDGQMNIEIDKSSHEFARPHGRRVHHIKDSPIAIRSRWAISHQVSKFRTHRKSERFDVLWRDSTGPQYLGALLVWNEEVIGNATIPDGIHRDRVGDDDHVFAASARP